MSVKLGNFDKLAKAYRKSRPSYSSDITNFFKILFKKKTNCLDIGSGTGIFTKELAKFSKKVVGVELSKSMIKNAHKIKNVKYINNSGEKIRLKEKFDLISAASCFHWLDNKKISKTINIHLKNKGFFFITYNSRDISENKFLKIVENKIISFNNNFKKRVSSGSSNFVKLKIDKFSKISKLKGPFEFKFVHYEYFSKKRYITAWESSNEFRNKMGKKNFNKFIQWLNKEFPKEQIKAKYVNNCWLFQK